jgi:hypothetical protein
MEQRAWSRERGMERGGRKRLRDGKMTGRLRDGETTRMTGTIRKTRGLGDGKKRGRQGEGERGRVDLPIIAPYDS